MTDNAMILAHRGSGGDQRLWFSFWEQLVSPPRWRGPSDLGSGAYNSSHGPALAATVRGVTPVVWKGAGGDQRLFAADLSRQTARSMGFPVRGPQGDFLTVGRPAIAASDGFRLLVWQDPGNALRWSTATSSGGPWTAPEAVGATTGHGPVLVVVGNQVTLIWTELGSGELRRARFSGTGWDRPAQVSAWPGAARSDDTPAVALASGRLYLAWKGVADQFVWFMQEGGTPVTVTPSAGAVLTTHGPALGQTTDPSLGFAFRLVWKGAGDEHIWWSSSRDGRSWTAPTFLSPAANSAAGPALSTYSVSTF